MTGLNRRHLIASGLALALPAPALASRCRTSRAQIEGGWEPGATLPIQTQEIYPAVLDDDMYLAGGLSTDGPNPINITDRAFVLRSWTPVSSTPGGDVTRLGCDADWHEIAPLPEPRHHPHLVAHGGKIHALGGFKAGNGGAWNMIRNHTVYDPRTNTWTETTPLPGPLGETVATSHEGRIHAVTGRQPTGDGNANWGHHGDVGVHYVYDSRTDRWESAAPNPNPRNSAAGVHMADGWHVVGGRRVNDGNLAHHEVYDFEADRWETRAPMPQGQGGLAAGQLGGELYAFGGEWFADGGGVYPNCWIYAPQSDSWRNGPSMLTPRHGLGAVSTPDRIITVAGATRVGGDGTSGIVEYLYRASE